ncbi:MAG: hypothetical protein U0N93_09120 [Collinsella sp.]
MFDDDGLFDLTDDPFEWDMLLDDDELDQDRKKRQDKKTQGTLRKNKSSAAEVCSAGSLTNRRIAVSVYLARV